MTLTRKPSYRWYFLLPFILFSLFADSLNTFASEFVYLIQLDDDMINPITSEYIAKSIDQATQDGAQCLIIKLDTPGGLLTSTRTIVKKILSAEIPIIVYIAPSGSRAGSAGVFITYASHIAAMAPSTNIGAAHPVELGGDKRSNKNDDELKDFLKYLLKKNREKFQQKLSQKNKSREGNKKNEKEKKKSGDENIRQDEKVKAKKTNLPSQETPNPQEENQDSSDTTFAKDEDPLSSKILNDTVAFIRALAKKRNRNVDWAVESVTKSSSITEAEALEKGVIEIIAKDDQDLLKKIHDQKIIVQDKEMILQTQNATIKKISMDARQKFFNTLANPNIAYLFMILGLYGLLYEITHPGFGLPGILGSVFLILAFFSLQTLPTNYAGLALIGLAVAFFLTEAFVPGFGLFAISGLICMILGSLLLFDSSFPMMRISLSLILAVSLSTTFLTLFLAKLAMKAYKRKAMGGKEGIIGEKGEAKTQIFPNKEGKVFVHGELWNAFSNEIIQKGENILVVTIEGLTLKVKKIS